VALVNLKSHLFRVNASLLFVSFNYRCLLFSAFTCLFVSKLSTITIRRTFEFQKCDSRSYKHVWVPSLRIDSINENWLYLKQHFLASDYDQNEFYNKPNLSLSTTWLFTVANVWIKCWNQLKNFSMSHL